MSKVSFRDRKSQISVNIHDANDTGSASSGGSGDDDISDFDIENIKDQIERLEHEESRDIRSDPNNKVFICGMKFNRSSFFCGVGLLIAIGLTCVIVISIGQTNKALEAEKTKAKTAREEIEKINNKTTEANKKLTKENEEMKEELKEFKGMTKKDLEALKKKSQEQRESSENNSKEEEAVEEPKKKSSSCCSKDRLKYSGRVLSCLTTLTGCTFSGIWGVNAALKTANHAGHTGMGTSAFDWPLDVIKPGGSSPANIGFCIGLLFVCAIFLWFSLACAFGGNFCCRGSGCMKKCLRSPAYCFN